MMKERRFMSICKALLLFLATFLMGIGMIYGAYSVFFSALLESGGFPGITEAEVEKIAGIGILFIILSGVVFYIREKFKLHVVYRKEEK